MYTIADRVGDTARGSGEGEMARVLVVDDERVVTEVVERYLRLEGYDVLAASDGEEALRLAQEWAGPDRPRPDVAQAGRSGGLPASSAGQRGADNHAHGAG